MRFASCSINIHPYIYIRNCRLAWQARTSEEYLQPLKWALVWSLALLSLFHLSKDWWRLCHIDVALEDLPVMESRRCFSFLEYTKGKMWPAKRNAGVWCLLHVLIGLGCLLEMRVKSCRGMGHRLAYPPCKKLMTKPEKFWEDMIYAKSLSHYCKMAAIVLSRLRGEMVGKHH
jgi:hypothetical protein